MLRTFFLVLLATAASTASALTIRDAYPRYMHEDHFKTVTEYLRGEQKEGPREVVRTQPEDRTGQYFILTLDSSVKELPANAEIALDILPTNLREPLTYRFSAADFQTASRQLYLESPGRIGPTDKFSRWRGASVCFPETNPSLSGRVFSGKCLEGRLAATWHASFSAGSRGDPRRRPILPLACHR